MRHINILSSALTLLVLSAPLASTAWADHSDREFRGGGDMRHFHERDIHVWRGGRWHHGYHDGRLGWWWLAGGLWYFYNAPVYPYPDPYIPPVVVNPPPVVIVPPAPAAPPPVVMSPPPAPVAAPPAQSWYYCGSARGYFPYVQTCPEGWQTVPASPPVPR